MLVILLLVAAAWLPFGYGCPSSLCQCTASNKIMCDNRRLDRVPRYLTEKRRVYTSLDLSRNRISWLPPFAFLNVRAKSLNLHHNHIGRTGISPRAFKGISATLKNLDLSANNIPVLHWAVFDDLRLLQSLTLKNNNMQALAKGLFQSLHQLTHLTLANNKIETISYNTLRGLVNVIELDLSSNNITSMEEGTFHNMRNLRKLNLDENKIQFLYPNSFTGLHNLHFLSVRNCKISAMSEGLFLHMPSVSVLRLGNNKLEEISPKTFAGAFDVTFLDLSSNMMKNFPTRTLTYMPVLASLNLSHNDIEAIGESCNYTLPDEIRELQLMGNPLNCTCQISWIRKYKHAEVAIHGKCATPSELNGVDVHALDFSSCSKDTCT